MGVPKVIMYTSPWCGYCARARTLLADKGVAFEEIDVELVPGAREEMSARSGGCSSVPQIFINDEYIGGSDELHALDAAGRLDPKLK
jgi:glutaredoxin 3